MGALKSLLLKSGSIGGVDSTVVYMYVHTKGMALLGTPPPSSETLMVMSYELVSIDNTNMIVLLDKPPCLLQQLV